jgi:DNA-binding NarL/FixJ family response regulator
MPCALSPSPPALLLEYVPTIGILLVDDSLVMRRILTEMLKAQPRLHVIGEAADGVAALQLVRQLCPEVVLMDVHMPRMNGIDSTRLIRLLSPQTIIIGMSTDSSLPIRTALLAAGACAFLEKESVPHQLLAVVTRELRRPSQSLEGL